MQEILVLLQQAAWELLRISVRLVHYVCRLKERPELRACAKVVAILQPSKRRGQIVGVVREDPFGKALLLMPCDPRMPICLLRSSDFPEGLKTSLKVSADLTARLLCELNIVSINVY